MSELCTNSFYPGTMADDLSFDGPQRAAMVFLARCSGRTLDAYRSASPSVSAPTGRSPEEGRQVPGPANRSLLGALDRQAGGADCCVSSLAPIGTHHGGARCRRSFSGARSLSGFGDTACPVEFVAQVLSACSQLIG